MEAALLMFDVVGIVLVALWVVRGRDSAALLDWREHTPPDPPDRKR